MRQNPHVRICGGPGSATTLVYPTARRLQVGVRLVQHLFGNRHCLCSALQVGNGRLRHDN